MSVAPFIAVQQSCYDLTKQACIHSGICPSGPLFVGCGALAGVCAQTLVYPLDVARKRMQAAQVPGGPPPPSSLVGALRATARDGGLRAWWAGILPAYLRVAPAIGTSLLVRDALLGRL